jgi:guanylate kinase
VSSEPLLVVLSGPSGVGKDSILERLRELHYPFHFTVTATTRQAREGETHGRDYFFLSEKEFQDLRQSEGLLESACVYGRWYGVPKQPVLEALARGQDVIMRTNVVGARSIRALAPGSVLIFISVPAIGALPERLRIRQTDSEEEIQRRIAEASEELQARNDFDYEVMNEEGRLDESVKTVGAIIQAEKCRINRPPLGLV